MSMISEQIEELRLMAEMFVNGEPYGNLLRRAAGTIEMLSEKAREPKRGEWIEQEDCWQCSECGDEYVLEVDVKPIDAKMYYCPYCGARMKGV